MNRLRLRLLALFALAFGLGATVHAQTGAQQVVFATSLGDITVELDAEHAPKTVENFVQYVKAGHYDGTVFHRVINNFMIQGGGFTQEMKEKQTRAPIALESSNGLENKRGTIAMARTNDPNSATAQFFINVNDNDFLNYKKFAKDTMVDTRGGPRLVPAGTVIDGYAVFGKVVGGMDVVDKIRAVQTGVRNGMQDVPNQPVIIKSAKLVTK